MFTLRFNGATWDVTERTAQIAANAGAISTPVSFGEDGYGNLYVVDLDGEVFRLTPGVASADQDDALSGNAGNDMIFAGSGNDRIRGGAGDDMIYGGAGFDTAIFAGAPAAYSVVVITDGLRVTGPDGADILHSVESLLFKPAPSNDANGDTLSDILWQNDDGTAGIWLMDGFGRLAGANVGFNPGPTWKVKSPGDFDGDGKSDILWQNDDGTPGIWLMDGLTRIAGANVGFNPGPSWQVKAAGDFNGDGKADILWQNTDGTAGLWLMDGLTRIADSGVGFNPGPTWKVIDAGDFNGDGKADILWQNDNGAAGIWLMDGFSRIADSGVGLQSGTDLARSSVRRFQRRRQVRHPVAER